MSKLRLYRGDSTKIVKFDFNKTRKYSLVGQGIYLTNSIKIAQSYREKNTSSRNDCVTERLYYGYDAFEWKKQAFNAFVINEYKAKFPDHASIKITPSFTAECDLLWERLFDEKKDQGYQRTRYQRRSVSDALYGDL